MKNTKYFALPKLNFTFIFSLFNRTVFSVLCVLHGDKTCMS